MVRIGNTCVSINSFSITFCWTVSWQKKKDFVPDMHDKPTHLSIEACIYNGFVHVFPAFYSSIYFVSCMEGSAGVSQFPVLSYCCCLLVRWACSFFTASWKVAAAVMSQPKQCSPAEYKHRHHGNYLCLGVPYLNERTVQIFCDAPEEERWREGLKKKSDAKWQGKWGSDVCC